MLGVGEMVFPRDEPPVAFPVPRDLYTHMHTHTQVTLKSSRLCLHICSYTQVCKNNKKLGMNLRENQEKSGHGKIWRGEREGISDGIIF